MFMTAKAKRRQAIYELTTTFETVTKRNGVASAESSIRWIRVGDPHLPMIQAIPVRSGSIRRLGR
jgi:hypothetical protein